MLTMRSALERAERLFGENTAIIDAEAVSPGRSTQTG